MTQLVVSIIDKPIIAGAAVASTQRFIELLNEYFSLGLTLVTIVYVGFKLYRLWKDRKISSTKVTGTARQKK